MGDKAKKSKRYELTGSGSEKSVQFDGDFTVNDKLNLLGRYYQQFGEYPVVDAGIEGNLKMFDSFAGTLGGSMVNTLDGTKFGGKLGLKYEKDGTSLKGTYERRPSQKNGTFGLQFEKKFY